MPFLDVVGSSATPSSCTVKHGLLSPGKSSQELAETLMRTGVAFLDTNITPPWNVIVEMFNKLDQDTIDEVNSFYDEKKIIKSVPSSERKPNIDQ